jgi:DNA-nicking Smr family endonuclease
MRTPRGLSESEAAAWARLAATVAPLDPSPQGEGHPEKRDGGAPSPAPELPRRARPRAPLRQPAAGSPARAGEERGLDSHWERRLRAGSLAPDFTLDLHEHSLEQAYQRLLGGLDLARESGARLVLVIAGRERPGPAADRVGQRGAIRAKLLDWLAASRHAAAIAAIRPAHRRHGGAGALYIVLRRAA